jgi:DNA polymerase-3 subunit chi
VRVDFYKALKRFAGDPPALLCAVAAKCLDGGDRLAWLVDDAASAAEVDERLWQLPPDSFLPHHIAGAADDADCPLLIVIGGTPSDRPILINQRRKPVDIMVERVIELIPPDPAGTVAARERWRDYARRGITPTLVEV